MVLNPSLHSVRELLNDAFADALDLQSMKDTASLSELDSQLEAIHATLVNIGNRSKRYANLWKITADMRYRWMIGGQLDVIRRDIDNLVIRLDK
jgi:hypothetical protein